MNNDEETQNTTSSSPIVVRVTLERNENGETCSTVPNSVLENAQLLDREVSLRIVDALSHRIDPPAFARFCTERGLDEEEAKTVRDLIDLNSGHITWGKLRCHLSRSFVFCQQLADALILERFAAARPGKDVEMYFLPTSKYTKGWLAEGMHSNDKQFLQELMDE